MCVQSVFRVRVSIRARKHKCKSWLQGLHFNQQTGCDCLWLHQSSKEPAAMLCYCASQAIQAAQVTVEDHFMSELGIHPLKVVGWEGVIGSAVMLGGALPLLQHLPFEDGSGLAEDSAGSWCMMKSSGTIARECCTMELVPWRLMCLLRCVC